MEGKEIHLHRPIEARQHGIEIVYQELALCDNLTAAANVFLSRELHKWIGPIRVLDYATMYKRAGALFKELNPGHGHATSSSDVRRPAAGRGDRPPLQGEIV
jgi:ABC-type sugar transport system ATPase subunit